MRIHKRIRLAPGLRVNVSGRGLSLSWALLPGLTLNAGKAGVRVTTGIPGTGISETRKLGKPGKPGKKR